MAHVLVCCVSVVIVVCVVSHVHHVLLLFGMVLSVVLSVLL